MQFAGEEEDDEKSAMFIKQPEKVVYQECIHVLHVPSLPACERHWQYYTHIKVNYHNTIYDKLW